MSTNTSATLLLAALLSACGTSATSEPPDPVDVSDSADSNGDPPADADPDDASGVDSDPVDAELADSTPRDTDADEVHGDPDTGVADADDVPHDAGADGGSDTGDDAVDVASDEDTPDAGDSGCAAGTSRSETLRCSDGRFVEVRCACVAGSFACPSADEACRDRSCDDGGELDCAMARPRCEGAGVIPAIIGGCWECVDRDTCRAPLPPICGDIGGFCSVGPAACPEGSERTDRGVCLSLGDCCLPRESMCRAADGVCFPEAYECPRGFVDGGGEPGCVSGQRCCVPHDGTGVCDDGTEWVCDLDPPPCDRFEIRAIQDGRATCVNPATCREWGEPGCADARDCEPGQSCDGCGTSSCPFCDDCVPACVER